MLRYLPIILVLVACAVTPPPTQTWESKTTPLTIEYDSTWTFLPAVDRESKVMAGVIDMQNGTTYLVHITPDVSKDSISDEMYYYILRKNYLYGDERNKILSEKDTRFHGMDYHELTLKRYNKKWGLQKHMAYVQRNGKKCIAVTMAFPVTESNYETEPLPGRLVQLDKQVKINGK